MDQENKKRDFDNQGNLSYLGECYVKLELAKRSIKTLKTYGFYFDFLTQNNCRVEVKAALPSKNRTFKKGKWYEYKYWQFRLSHSKQQADFFVCVVFDTLEKPPRGIFIFPRTALATLESSQGFSIFESDLTGDFKKQNKIDKVQYLNNWQQILSFKVN